MNRQMNRPRVPQQRCTRSSIPACPTVQLMEFNRELQELPLAMAYVPMQSWGETYDGLKALDSGTIFPELDLPFCGRRLSK